MARFPLPQLQTFYQIKNAETTTRATSDTNLQTQLNAETATRISVDSSLQNELTQVANASDSFLYEEYIYPANTTTGFTWTENRYTKNGDTSGDIISTLKSEVVNLS